MKRLRLLPVLLLLGCVAPTTDAEVATYKAIAPEYRSYVQADPALSESDKRLRINTLERWADALKLTGADR